MVVPSISPVAVMVMLPASADLARMTESMICLTASIVTAPLTEIRLLLTM